MERTCIDCAAPLVRAEPARRWPTRCPECKLKAKRARDRAAPKGKKYARQKADRAAKTASRPPRVIMVACDCGTTEEWRGTRGAPAKRCLACRMLTNPNLQWRLNNYQAWLQLALAAAHRRRARKFGGEFESFLPREIFDRDKWICYLCGRICRDDFPAADSATLDHVIPLSAGGPHTVANCKTACFECNIQKGASVAD